MSFQKGNKLAVKHGLSKTRLHTIWHSMYCRCNYPTTNGYKNYGGRGIKICKEWQEFINFHDWAVANGYFDNLTLDRIDIDGDYEPSNCRWETPKNQSNHKSNNVYYSFEGETKTAKQWCDKFKINPTTFHDRIKRGWTIEQALTISAKGKQRKIR